MYQNTDALTPLFSSIRRGGSHPQKNMGVYDTVNHAENYIEYDIDYDLYDAKEKTTLSRAGAV